MYIKMTKAEHREQLETPTPVILFDSNAHMRGAMLFGSMYHVLHGHFLGDNIGAGS